MLGLWTAHSEAPVRLPYPEERCLQELPGCKDWGSLGCHKRTLSSISQNCSPQLHVAHERATSLAAHRGQILVSCLPSRVPLSSLEVPVPGLNSGHLQRATVQRRGCCAQSGSNIEDTSPALARLLTPLLNKHSLGTYHMPNVHLKHWLSEMDAEPRF